MDKTDLIVKVMYRELEDFHKIEEDFVSEFSKQDFDWIVKVKDTDVFGPLPATMGSIPRPTKMTT